LARRVLAVTGLRPADAPYARWDYAGTDEIMQEIAALTPNYAGVSHERLERGERLMWPVRTAEHPGTEILYRTQFARGRGRFVAVAGHGETGSEEA
jgi:predicted molibdopterin-dependent oxidoreductase YjgC